MAPDEKGPEELPRDEGPPRRRPRPLIVRLAHRSGEHPGVVRLVVKIPPRVEKVFRATGRVARAEVERLATDYFDKLAPRRGPSDKGTYPGEVLYFERLLVSRPEALTRCERLFVTGQKAVEAFEALAAEARECGEEELAAEAQAAADALALRVNNAQELVRRERGDKAPQADLEASEP
jgi:hypothetical protein